MIPNIFEDDFFEGLFPPMMMGPIINKPLSPKTFLSTYLSAMGNIDKDSANVLIYIIENCDAEHVFHGNYDELVDKLEISRPKLAKSMILLQEMKYIQKTSNGWKVLLDIEVPKENGTITIHFNKGNQQKELDKYIEKIDFDKFANFIKEYYTSYARFNKEEANKINSEENVNLLNSMINEYKSNEKDKDFLDYIKDKNLENQNFKNFLTNSVNIYTKEYSNSNKKYLADFYSSDLAETKQMYIKAIKDVDILSGETKLILISIFIKAINDIVYSYNSIPTYNNIKAYLTREKHRINPQMYEYIVALFTIFEDQNQIVIYQN